MKKAVPESNSNACENRCSVIENVTFLTHVDEISCLARSTPWSLSTCNVIYGPTRLRDTAVVPVTLCDVATLDSKAVESWETILEDFLAKDDVICPRFLQNLIVILRDDHLLSVPEKVIASLVEKWGVESIRTCTTSNDTDSTILDGPYFVQHSAIYHAWRIYEDPVGAFMCSIAPALSASNAGAGITFESLQISGIATPSRLYSEEKCERRPLSGMRFGIKDVIDVKGVVTTCGNRAYESLHGRAQESATCVERLLDAGAVIVGKTKTVQFASGETARDWIDYQASFNIRGDGYQEPGGSSAGSAAGVAAYTWLDGAIGTDTFGSVLAPAANHGLFGLRTTLGAIPSSGSLHLSRLLDTIGAFTRNLDDLMIISSVMSDPHIDHVTEDEPAATWDILYPRRYFESFSKIYQAMCDGFISQLENHLGRQRKEVDVSSLWAKSGVSDTSLEDYLRTTLAHLQLHDCWQNNQLWLKKFRAKFGREPIADPLIRYKWQLGEAVTQDQYDAAVKERELFGSWFRTSVMADEGERLPATYNRLMLLPMLRSGQLNPTYRYEYPSRSFDEVARSRQGFGFDPDNLPILSGLPCINIPFDQISYHSDASGVTERLPVSISLVGPEGSDHALMRMARDFLKNAPQLQTKVKCGSKAF